MANYATSALKLSDTYVNTLPYNTCSTAAGTAAKTVNAGTFSLETGAMVVVKFTTTNTAANPTLNVSSTGAKAIYYNGAAITAGYLKANKVYQFIYNGTQWDLVGDVDTDTTYTFNGAVSSIKNIDLTANRALVSSDLGKIAVHPSVTSTELGYLDGVTSNVQTQLNGKTKRVVLTGQCQKTSYRMSLIALCKAPVDAAGNPGGYYSAGRITLDRSNNLYAPITLDVTMGGSHGAVGRIRCSYSTNGAFEILKPCTFTYNGVVYGGLAFQYADAECSVIEFNGATTTDIFALDVYDTQNKTALDTAVYNSINYDNEIYVDHGLYVNGDDVLSGLKDNIKTSGTSQRITSTNSDTPFRVQSNDSVSYIAYEGDDGALFGYIGVNSNKQPVFVGDGTRTIYHSGNYTSIPAATSSAKGLVKSGGDITVASDGAVTVNNATTADSIATTALDLSAGKTIANIRTQLAAWVANNAGKTGVACTFVSDLPSLTTNWNAENTTATIAGGTTNTVYLDSYYGGTNYALLRITTYQDKRVYYTALVNGTWQPMRKVAFDNDLSAKMNTSGGAFTGKVSTTAYSDANGGLTTPQFRNIVIASNTNVTGMKVGDIIFISSST